LNAETVIKVVDYTELTGVICKETRCNARYRFGG